MRKKIKAIAFFVYSIELNLTSAFTMLAITFKQASPFSKKASAENYVTACSSGCLITSQRLQRCMPTNSYCLRSHIFIIYIYFSLQEQN